MKKVLFLSGNNIFEAIGHGGTIVSKGNYDILTEAFGSENVYVLLLTGDKFEKQEHITYIPKHKNKIEYFFNSLFLRGRCNRKKEKMILDYIKQESFDIIFFDGSLYGKILRRVNKRGIKTIVFFHNVEKDFAHFIMKNNGYLYFTQYLSAWYNEKLSMAYGNKLITLNDRDSLQLKRYYGREAQLVVPVWHADKFNPQSDKTKDGMMHKTLLFVGNAGLQANVDGITWFANEVMPHLPEFTLFIVGREFEKYSNLFTGSNINLIGTVAELDTYYYEAGAVVSPILYGAGMKTKTAEALMYGKVVFASDEALAGYQVEGVYGIWRCNTAEEYIRTIKEFWESGDIISAQTQVRNLFLNHYEKNVVKSNYISQLLL